MPVPATSLRMLGPPPLHSLCKLGGAPSSAYNCTNPLFGSLATHPSHVPPLNRQFPLSALPSQLGANGQAPQATAEAWQGQLMAPAYWWQLAGALRVPGRPERPLVVSSSRPALVPLVQRRRVQVRHRSPWQRPAAALQEGGDVHAVGAGAVAQVGRADVGCLADGRAQGVGGGRGRPEVHAAEHAAPAALVAACGRSHTMRSVRLWPVACGKGMQRSTSNKLHLCNKALDTAPPPTSCSCVALVSWELNTQGRVTSKHHAALLKQCRCAHVAWHACRQCSCPAGNWRERAWKGRDREALTCNQTGSPR